MGFFYLLVWNYNPAASRSGSTYTNFIFIVTDEELKSQPAIVDRKKGEGPYKAFLIPSNLCVLHEYRFIFMELGFPKTSTLLIFGPRPFRWQGRGRCPVHCRMFSSIPGPYQVSSTQGGGVSEALCPLPSLSWDNQKGPQTLPNVPWEENCLHFLKWLSHWLKSPSSLHHDLYSPEKMPGQKTERRKEKKEGEREGKKGNSR